MTIIKYLLSIISGGVILELIKLFYPDLKRVFDYKVEAKKIFNKHSDSILKAADELFGKLYSLAKEDFSIFTKYNHEKDEMNKIYILYLFAGFWANLGILKQESSFIHLARINKGKRLLCFITSYESRKNRILERSIQRAIGESIITENSKGLKTLSLYEFTQEYKKENSNIKNTIEPLEQTLFDSKDKEVRQKILLFGIIVMALIDFLDKKHHVVREREPYINKLSIKTRDQLRNRIFPHYLPFVDKPYKYYKK